MSEGFDARALDERYRVLDSLSPALYAAVVTHPTGVLETRASGVACLRRALLAGTLPFDEELAWPSGALGKDLLELLRRLDIARYCREQPELVDALLLDIFEVALRPDAFHERFLEEELRELRRLEEERRRREAEAAGKPAPAGSLTAAIVARLRRQANATAALRAARQALQRFEGVWAERVRTWAKLAEVFGELGTLLGRGWDLGRGLLASQGWLETARLAELLGRLPELREVVRTLGRMQSSVDAPEDASLLERVVGTMTRVREELREVPDPRVPAETRGVTLSDDVTRMLPAEAALLAHPRLKFLWHARRAERRLATYQVEGVERQRVLVETEEAVRRAEPPTRLERGPVIVCLDTSGSMAGVPERVSKAVVIEALRVATAEKRRCFVYLFSGPGDVAERELSLSPEGLAEFLSFLCQSFHGGTDVEEPLRRALARLKTEGWRRADILLVSDGEFPVPAETAAAIRAARKTERLRVHGLLVGNSSSAAMGSICDPLHRFTEWESLSRGGVPA